jgi:hypothetical protein
MKIRVEDGKIPSGQFFKPIATGYTLGGLLLFAPFLILFAVMFGLIFLLGGGQTSDSGLTNTDFLQILLLQIILLPIVLILQSIMFGGLSILGLWVYTTFIKKGPIEVELVNIKSSKPQS